MSIPRDPSRTPKNGTVASSNKGKRSRSKPSADLLVEMVVSPRKDRSVSTAPANMSNAGKAKNNRPTAECTPMMNMWWRNKPNVAYAATRQKPRVIRLPPTNPSRVCLVDGFITLVLFLVAARLFDCER